MTAPTADRGLARYVRRTIYPFSAHYRAVLDATGVGRRVRGLADLAQVPPTELTALTDPGSLVLRPDLGRILRQGRPALAAWGVAAKATGGMHGFSRHIERRFKPIQWVLADGVPLGYSSVDLQHLGRRGVAWLERAGVHRGDVVVSLLAPGPSVAYWQLVLGCRRAGVSAIHLGPAADPAMLERLVPSVLVGECDDLLDVLATAREGGHRLAWVRTVLAVGGPLGADRRGSLRDLAAGVPVVAAWAPAGVRAIWSECRAGSERPAPTGYHAWDDDVLEATPPGVGPVPGELLWTGVGWGGSALLRLRTFAVTSVSGERCPACGQRGPLVVPHAPVARSAVTPGPAGSWPVSVPTDGLAAVAWSPAEVGATATLIAPVGAPSSSAAAPSAPPPAPPPSEPPPVEDVFDADPDVAAWHVEYRSVAGAPETIVTLAPAWGAAVVPLIRRLDRHLRATQFVIVPVAEVAVRVEAAGGRRVIGIAGP